MKKNNVVIGSISFLLLVITVNFRYLRSMDNDIHSYEIAQLSPHEITRHVLRLIDVGASVQRIAHFLSAASRFDVFNFFQQRNAVIAAIRANRPELLRYLLSVRTAPYFDTDSFRQFIQRHIDATDRQGRSALQIAVNYFSDNQEDLDKNNEIIDILLENGACPFVELNSPVKTKKIKIVQKLLDAMRKCLEESNDNQYENLRQRYNTILNDALLWARIERNQEIIRYLNQVIEEAARLPSRTVAAAAPSEEPISLPEQTQPESSTLGPILRGSLRRVYALPPVSEETEGAAAGVELPRRLLFSNIPQLERPLTTESTAPTTSTAEIMPPRIPRRSRLFGNLNQPGMQQPSLTLGSFGTATIDEATRQQAPTAISPLGQQIRLPDLLPDVSRLRPTRASQNIPLTARIRHGLTDDQGLSFPHLSVAPTDIPDIRYPYTLPPPPEPPSPPLSPVLRRPLLRIPRNILPLQLMVQQTQDALYKELEGYIEGLKVEEIQNMLHSIPVDLVPLLLKKIDEKIQSIKSGEAAAAASEIDVQQASNLLRAHKIRSLLVKHQADVFSASPKA